MKRILLALSLLGALALTACGPKTASKETLEELNKAKSAYEAAKQRKAELEAEIEKLRQEKSTKEAELQRLQHERDSLRAWLDILEQGY